MPEPAATAYRSRGPGRRRQTSATRVDRHATAVTSDQASHEKHEDGRIRDPGPVARQAAMDGARITPAPSDDVAAAWWKANGMPAKITDPAVLHAIITLAFRQSEAPSQRQGRNVAHGRASVGRSQ